MLLLLPLVAVAQPAPGAATSGRPFVVRVPAGSAAALAAARPAPRVEQVRAAARAVAGLAPADELVALRTETDPTGNEHAWFQQVARGVPVEHGRLTAHYRAGLLTSLSGELKTPTAPSTTPNLPAADARQRALAAVGARRYQWQDPTEEQQLRRQTHNPAATWLPAGELVWVEDFLGTAPGSARPVVLAWRFEVVATEPLVHERVYVDAHTGRVVLRDALLRDVHSAAPTAQPGAGPAPSVPPRHRPSREAAPTAPAATGTFATRYSGTRVGETEAINGRFRLRDSSRGAAIVTLNTRRSTVRSTAVDFLDTDNNWTAAEYDNAAKDNSALDIHWGTQRTYDYFRQRHNRRSFDGADARLESYVHYGVNLDNAFWDGWRMVYGDGGSRYASLTAVDVVGHEVGHGVCQYTAGLIHYDQPAALNEGLSDIWGACVEQFTDSTKDIWSTGGEIDLNNPDGLRSLRNPKLTFCPDTYRGQYYTVHRFAEPHMNSTILSHWFYLVSQGGTGTNDLGRTYAVAGIGIRRAAQIVYHLETAYLTPTSTYPDAWRGSVAAVADLYGENSPEALAVARAWYAVGLGDELPVLASVQPAQGPVGAWLLLEGTGLAQTRAITFGGATDALEFAVLDSGRVRVRVPVGALTGRISLTTPLGTALSPAEFMVTSQGAAPVVSGFAPVAGQRVGGTVTVDGRNLTGATAVRFGGVAAVVFSVQSATRLTAVVPPTAVTGELEIETPGGRATAPAVCRVVPVLTAFSPTSGPPGTHLTLTGTGLTGASGGTVADSAARLLPGGTATTASVVAPVGITDGLVRLTTAGGIATAPGRFTLTAAVAPDLTGFSPASGGPNVLVTLTGRGLISATGVEFSGAPGGAAGTRWVRAGQFLVESDTVITVVVPLLVATGPLRVTTPAGTDTTALAFRVTAAVCRLAVALDGGAGPGVPVCAVPGTPVRLRAVVAPGTPLLAPTYTVAPLPYAPYPEPTTPGPPDWYLVMQGVPIGFAFQFFGRPCTTLNISSSANIQFSSVDPAGDYYAPIPFAAAPQNFIALAWRAWNPRGNGHVTYGTVGTAPNRRLVVSYFEVPYIMDVTHKFSGQIVLHETTNYIDLIYTSTGRVAYMSAGAENLSGTIGVSLPGKNTAVMWQAEREAWRLTPASVPSPVTYTWSPGTTLGTNADAQLIAPTTATAYTVTVRDGGCVRTATLTVAPAPAPLAAAPAVARCGPGPVTLRATGAPTGGTYAWYAEPAGGTPIAGATGAAFTTPSLAATTTYYVAAVGAGGCAGPVRIARTAIIVDGAPPVPVLTAMPATVALGQAVQLAVAAPPPGVTYRWTGPGLPPGGAVGARVSAQPVAAGAAVYTVVATAQAGCGAAASVSLTVPVTAAPTTPTLLSFSPTSGPVGLVVELTGLALTGTTAVRFAGPAGGVSASILPGRTATRLRVRVPVGALPGPLTLLTAAGAGAPGERFCVELVPTTGPGARCGPGPVVLTAGGAPAGAFYRWYAQPVGGVPLATTASAAFSTPSISTTQQFFVSIVVGTGAAACEGLRTAARAQIQYVPRPTIGANEPLTFCRGRSIRLYSGGSTEAVWNTGERGFSIIVDSSGTYWYTGTIYDSCPVRSDSAVVVVTDPPVAAFRYDTTVYCQQAAILRPTLTGTLGGKFRVSPAGLAVDSLTGAVALAASAPGVYQITYTVRTACPDTARATVPFRLLAAPVVGLTASGPTTFCLGDSVVLTASGGGPYQWSTGATSASIIVRTSGAYYVAARRAGCTATTAPLTVVARALPPVPLITQAPAPGGTLLTSSAPSGNQWLLSGAPIGGAASPTLLVTAPGLSGPYAVVVTDSAGCVSAPSVGLLVMPLGVGAEPGGPAALQLRPNPARGQVLLTGAVPQAEVVLYDAIGRRLMMQRTTADGYATLALTGLAPGVYVVRVGAAVRRLVVE